ncbi:redoxin domain-containing protein [Mucilaginibacter sp. AW1-3]
MKKIFLMLMAAIPAAVFAQAPATNFTLKTKIGTIGAPAKVYLGYQVAGKNVIDSSAIVNGEATFQGHLNSPVAATIVIDAKGTGLSKIPRGSDLLNFYLEKSTITLTSADSVSKAAITGSKVNDDNKLLMTALKPTDEMKAAVLHEADTAADALKISPYFQNSIQRKYKVALAQEEEVMRKFIADNPKSFISLAALGTINNSSADPFEMEKIFNTLAPEVRTTEGGVSFKQMLDIAKTTAIGSIAPDFTQADTSGKPVTLSSLRGKYVLIDFWASWCGPCRQENPNVVRVYNQYKAKNFTVLGVSLDREDGKAAWLKAIKDDGLTWTQVSDLKYWANQAGVLYKVNSIPQNYLLDPTGKIIAKNLRGADLEAKLAEVLK